MTQNIFLTFLTLLALLPFISFSQPAWEQVTPTPQENHINDLAIIPGTDKVIAVADGASIMISEDQGETWQISCNPGGLSNESCLKRVYFYNSLLGFAGGYHYDYSIGYYVPYILKSTDGGVSWAEITNFPGTGAVIANGFYFVNEQTGFIIAGSGRLLKTVDCGESWFDLETGVTFTLDAIDFCNDSTGYIVGPGTEKMLKTTDYGNTWSAIDFNSPLTDYGLKDIHFVSNTIGYVAHTNGSILKTTNAGIYWDVVYANQYIKAQAINFFDENHGIAGCYKQSLQSCIISTNDGGNTWDEFILPVFQDINYSVCCLDAANFLYCGLYGMIYKSVNGGNTWAPKFERTFWGDIYQVQYLDENSIFCLTSSRENYSYQSSNLYKSIDGGENFVSIADVEVNDNNIFTPATFGFIDYNLGYLTYYNNNDDLLTVLKTDDGGDNWTEVESGNYDGKPYAMKFYDELNGLISGDGFILKTSDGGNNWQEVYNGYYTYFLMDIHYFSANDIIVSGASYWSSTLSKLIISHDAGSTWEEMPLGVYGIIFDMEVINNTIYLACEDNVIMKSPDGGNTWQYTQVISPNDIEFHSIHFPVENIGYAVGSGPFETMVKTTDGGNTWNVIHTGISSGLNAVHFYDEFTGFVFSENGVVLKTTTGGTTAIEEFRPVKQNTCFSVYPNPFTKSFSVQYQLPVGAKSGIIEIFSQNGKSILIHHLKNSTDCINLHGENLEPGVYLIVLKTGNKLIETQKLIKLP